MTGMSCHGTGVTVAGRAPRRLRRAPIVVDPCSGWGLFFPAAGSQGGPVPAGQLTDSGPNGGGGHCHWRLHLGRTFVVVLIMSVVVTAAAASG
jgi:hypothetical protein